MSEPKPLASLTAGLLARKGGARPAMRPQLYSAHDDLGFNDMGAPARRPAPIGIVDPVAPTPPEARRHAAPAVAAAAPSAARDRTAFTLRLDRERHLKLKLAGVHGHRSAQSIVTEALDRFLADFDPTAH